MESLGERSITKLAVALLYFVGRSMPCNSNIPSVPSAAVGTMYLNGQGCDKDEATGLECLKQSSEGGCMYGTGRLALHYFSTKLFSKAAETAFKYVAL